VPTKTAVKLEGAKSTVVGKREQLKIARALADPTRFEIFRQIAAGRCVACSDVREHFTVTAPTISHHLKELEAANLIEATRAGKFMNLTFRRDVWRAYLEALARI
jgi:ArsR family transcriptional regulator